MKKENDQVVGLNEPFMRLEKPAFDPTATMPDLEIDTKAKQLSQFQLQSFFNEFYLSYANPVNIFELTMFLPVDAEGCKMPNNTVWTINMRGYPIKVAGFEVANFNPQGIYSLFIHYKKTMSSYGTAGNGYRFGCTVANYSQNQWFDALRLIVHRDSYNDFDRYVNTGRY